MKKFYIIALTVGVVVVDLLTKWWAVNNLNIVLNDGIAFGIGLPSSLIVLSNIVFLPLLIWILYGSFDFSFALPGFIVALITGGALGNLIDRVADGYVVDFIDLNFWPSFNIADVAVVTGVLLAVAFYDKIKRNSTYG